MADNDIENISDKPQAPLPPKNRVLIDSRELSPPPNDYIPYASSESKTGWIWFFVIAVAIAVVGAIIGYFYL